MTIVAETPSHVDTLGVTLGVDTHAGSHVAAVIDPLGRHLAQASFETTIAGFKALLAWASGFGTITGGWGGGHRRLRRRAGCCTSRGVTTSASCPVTLGFGLTGFGFRWSAASG